MPGCKCIGPIPDGYEINETIDVEIWEENRGQKIYNEGYSKTIPLNYCPECGKKIAKRSW